MQSQPRKITRKQAKPIIDLVYPDYRGRKIKVIFTDTVTLYDLHWSGGTKSTYKYLSTTGNTYQVPAGNPFVASNEGDKINMIPSVLVVVHSYFCGEDAGITIYSHPDNAPRLLSLLN